MAIHRYENTPQRRNGNNKRTVSTQIPPVLTKDGRDIYIYTREGDRLDLLANEYYSDRTMWTFLAAANNLKEIMVKPGIQLRIPYDPDLVNQEWIKQNNNR